MGAELNVFERHLFQLEKVQVPDEDEPPFFYLQTTQQFGPCSCFYEKKWCTILRSGCGKGDDISILLLIFVGSVFMISNS